MHAAPEHEAYDVVVVGAGVIGLACAWRIAEQGLGVCVLEREPEPGAGASGVAAGMLAPVTEAEFGEQALLALNMTSAERWPAFADELRERTQADIGYHRSGALVVAADRDDAEELRRLHDFQRSLGLDVEWLVPSAARKLEPALSPRIGGAIHAPHEAQADPRALVTALAGAFRAAGGELVTGADVTSVAADRVEVQERARSRLLHARHVIVAAGSWSGGFEHAPPVRPVKGQIIRLRRTPGTAPLATRLIRSPRAYIVDRPNGEIVVGATVEDKGWDTSVTVDAIYTLLEAAWEVLPDTRELEWVEAKARLRPGTPDNAPVIGTDDRGVIWATGHYRNGILLAPITADAIAAIVTGTAPPEATKQFGPTRWAVAAR